MQQSQTPDKFPIPFANGAGQSYIRSIPPGSQIGINNGAASLQDGFPPLNFVPVGSGGVPPFGQDMNGILRQITQWSRWQGAGGTVTWDSAFSTSIGGYPRGALLSSTSAGGLWLSTADNNVSNPDGGTSANWLPIMTGAAVPQTSLLHAGDDTSTTPGVITIPVITPPITNLANHQIFEIVPNLAITGPTLVQLATFGSVPLKRRDGGDPQAGDGPAGQSMLVVFRSGVLRRLDAAPSETSTRQTHYGVAGGSPSALTIAAVDPPISAYVDGMEFLVRMPSAFGVASGATLTVGSLAALPIQRNDGSPIVSGDGPPGAPVRLVVGGGAFRLVGFGRAEVPVIQSAASTTLYIRPNGNDATADGSDNTDAKAFRTPRAALLYGTSRFSLAGGTLLITLGTPGTYETPGILPATVGALAIQGDSSNPGAYVLAGAGPSGGTVGVISGQSGYISLTGLTIRNTGTINNTLQAGGPVSIALNSVILTSDAPSQYAHMSAGGGGFIGVSDGCIAQGSMGALASATNGGNILIVANVTLQGSPYFSDATVTAGGPASVTIVSGKAIIGTATGRRFRTSNNATIQTFGAGDNAFPGNQAGVRENGGVYV